MIDYSEGKILFQNQDNGYYGVITNCITGEMQYIGSVERVKISPKKHVWRARAWGMSGVPGMFRTRIEAAKAMM